MKYYYADPTGNITLLIRSRAYLSEYPMLASLLMSLESSAEQVGFLEPPARGGDIRLHMAGGEFCGNAALSTAAAYLSINGRISGTVKTEVFGLDTPLKAWLQKTEDGAYVGNIEMPLPALMEKRTFTLGENTYILPLVEFNGISHILFSGEPFPEAEKAVKLWCNELGASALGIMFLSEDLKRMAPLVYVPSADTLFWESSCASGTCAAAAWLAKDAEKPVTFDFHEPGGILSAEACKGTLRLLGRVKLEQKTAEI